MITSLSHLRATLVALAFAALGLSDPGHARSPLPGPLGPEWIEGPDGPVRGDRLLARFHGDEKPAAEPLLSKQGVTIRSRLQRVPGVVVLSFAPVDADGLVARIKSLQASGLFAYVEPDAARRLSAVPADAAFTDGRLWGLRNTGRDGGLVGADIDAERAWDITTGSPVIVAVIDTGIRYTHNDLRDNMWRNPGESGNGKETNGVDDDRNGYVDDVHGINAINRTGNPMDDNDHGSHCAGTIGATANGGGPHVGVAWNVRLMGVKFLSAGGRGATSDALLCIDYAVAHGAKVLSNSWGGGGFSSALRDSILAARDAGALFVAAAGNDGVNLEDSPEYPASYDLENMLAVAALDRSDRVANFSNYGATTVHLGAPGAEIFSCTRESDSSYTVFDGTSMATPHVAGVAALVVSAFPNAGYREIRQRLIAGSRQLPALVGRAQAGALDAHGSLSLMPDGVLELQLSASRQPLPAGTRANLFVRVTDLFPVAGATVNVRVAGAAPLAFTDDGISPDARIGDGVYSGAVDVPAVGEAVTVVVTATARGAAPAEASFSLPLATPPANDAFAQRLAVEPTATRTTGSNVNASTEPAEPIRPSGAGSRSVWWTWTAPESRSVTLTTAGSSFDTTLAVYRGTTLSSLQLVAENDDEGGGFQSAVTFASSAGVTYLVQVNGYAGATGSIVLNHPVTGGLPGAPQIISAPAPGSVLVGQSFSLQVAAEGEAPLAYQWTKDGQEINGATASTFSRAAAALSDEGLYRVRVSNARGTAISQPAFLGVEQIALIPENDAFAAAAVLPAGQGRVRSSNRLATGEPGEPAHAGRIGPPASLWWRFTAPADGLLELNTFGSGFDTVLAVYQGASVGALTVVAANDDADASRQSAVTVSTVTGTSYFIALDSARTATGVAFLNHSFSSAAEGPANDRFAARRAVPADGSDTGTTVGATGEPGEPDHADASLPHNSVWWKWTAPANGQVIVSTNGSDFDTTLALYRGTAVNNLTLVAEDDDGGDGRQSLVRTNVSPGTELAIAVDSYGSDAGRVELSVQFVSSVLVNDRFTQAILIPAGTSQVTGNTRGATGDPGEPLHHDDGVAPLESAWWSWTAPMGGRLTIDLTGSDFDTVLAVYRGASLGSLVPVASNDDNGFSLTSKVSFMVSRGEIYRIAVDGYGDNNGTVQMALSFSEVVAPPNDAFAQATPIPGGTARVTGTTVGATGQTGEPSHYSTASLPLNSVWWRWTAPQNGILTLDLEGSDFDTLLAVYRGSAVNALTRVASDDDGGSLTTSRLTTPVFAGQTYSIAVDGYEGNIGDVVMAVRFELSQSLGEALDAPALVWTTGGQRSWFSTGLGSVVGTFAARSGSIDDSEQSWLQTTVAGPGRLRYWWKTDTEDDYDVLAFSLDGDVRVVHSGFQPWTSQLVTIPSGAHTVRWTYRKDSSFAFGEDVCWIDGIVFEPQGYVDWMARQPNVPLADQGMWNDPDLDGHPNALEYFLNTPPATGIAGAAWGSFSRESDGDVVWTYLRHKNPQGVTGALQWSPNLVTWGASGATVDGAQVRLIESVDSSPATHNRVTVRATGAPGTGAPDRLYWRLHLTVP